MTDRRAIVPASERSVSTLETSGLVEYARDPMAHDDDHDDGCDHDSQSCGAAPVSGLAACPYCRAAYAGLQAGCTCPKCSSLSVRGRAVCAQCNGALTRACVFCNAVSLLELHQCTRCHEAFDGAVERKRERERAAKAAGPVVNADPTGANIFNTLNSILKS